MERHLKTLFVLILTACFFSCTSSTPPITDTNGNIIPGSVAEMTNIKIGGTEQFVLIRGKSVQNPILLFLHGGPGSVETPMVRKYNSELEDHFIVVNWDQRGAGKSFHFFQPEHAMNADQIVSDTRELTLYLLQRFDQKKIFLVGHSWGSFLGILTVRRYPELFRAFVGIGQLVSPSENEKVSYQFALSNAAAFNDTNALNELRELNRLEPYLTIDRRGDWFKNIRKERNYVLLYGGEIYGQSDYDIYYTAFSRSSEYSFPDLIRFWIGVPFSFKNIFPGTFKMDLAKEASELKVPVYFFLGRHDHVTPSSVALKYFLKLKAPRKELIWFERSAHNALYEESAKFNDLMVRKILAENVSK